MQREAPPRAQPHLGPSAEPAGARHEAAALRKGGAMAEQERERAEARYRSALPAVRASRIEPAISLRAI